MKFDNPLRSSDVRLHNQKIILSRIYKAKKAGISQSELVTETGLKAPTVFRIFSNLEEQGLIELLEDEKGEEPENNQMIPAASKQKLDGNNQTRMGRRPAVYRVRKDALFTIGLGFWASSISLGIFNFQGDRIYSHVESLKANISIDIILKTIVKLINEILEKLNIDKTKVAGIGLAAPGQVDLIQRKVINYPRIKGMQNIPLAEMLEEMLDIDIIIHNNCSVIALSEYNYGGYDHEDSLFTFLLRYGVNGAFVDKRGIYTTGHGITLETGHLPVDSKGPQCNCGKGGCLESQLCALDSENNGKQQLLFQGLEERLKTNDSEAEKIVSQAANYLFIVTKSIMRFFTPRSFLILGNGELVSQKIAENLQKRWQEESDDFVVKIPRFFGSIYNPLIFQQGASDLVMTHYFS